MLRRTRRSAVNRVGALVTGLAASLVAGLVVPAASSGSPGPQGVWPLDPPPPVVRRFDPPLQRWQPGHRGVDLAGAVGQTVRAALGGTVSFTGWIAGRGVVVVDHGQTRTTYEPVSASVRRGARVGAGASLGQLAWFGSHCAPRACLHWGFIEGSDHYLDPLTLVGCSPAPVRLLPLDRPPPSSSSPCASAQGSSSLPRQSAPAGPQALHPVLRSAGRLAAALAVSLHVPEGFAAFTLEGVPDDRRPGAARS